MGGGLQIGVGQSRLGRQRLGVDPGPLELFLQPDGEVAHGEFGVAVHAPRVEVAAQVRVVGVDGPAHVLGGARQRDDARPRGGDDDGQQVRQQGPVTEHIGAHLGVEAVHGGALRHRHHTGVAHQDVDARVLGGDGVGGGLHRGERAEVEFDDLQGRVRVRGEDLVACARGLGLIAGRHDDVGAVTGERLGRGQAQPAVGAGDDGGLAVQVGDVVDGPAHGVPLRGATGWLTRPYVGDRAAWLAIRANRLAVCARGSGLLTRAIAALGGHGQGPQ